MSDSMNFGQAIEALKNGNLVQRKGWNGKGMWLELVKSDKDFLGRVILPYILMKTVTNEFVPWLASQTDVLAEDWSIVTYNGN